MRGSRRKRVFTVDQWPERDRKPLLGYLSHYLDKVRPRLLGATAAIFVRVSIRLYGVRLHPHTVRYTEVTTMLWHDPNSLDIAAAALGHHGTRTTDQLYDQSTTRGAQRVWLDLVKKMKQG
jgi:hypothetical protein